MMAMITNRINNIDDDKAIDLALRFIAILLLVSIILGYVIANLADVNISATQAEVNSILNQMGVM